MPKSASGKEVVKILIREFAFIFVPMHKELARGTLRGVCDLAHIDFQVFKKFL